MVSLIAAPNHLRLFRSIFHPANSSAVFIVRLATRQQFPPGLKLNQAGLNRFIGVARRCKISESEDYSVLEQEVLSFMLRSEDPDRFPSRKELIKAGKRDLADAIVKRGGWMTRGWDLVSDDESEEAELDVLLTKWDSISGKLGQGQQKRQFKINAGEKLGQASSDQLGSATGFSASGEERSEVSSAQLGSSSSPPASSSGRSIEIEADEDSGIEGILNRLDKQRNLSFGLYMERKDQLQPRGSEAADSHFPLKDAEADLSLENNSVSIQEKMLSDSRRVTNLKGLSNLSGVRNSTKPDAWRRWSMQRAGCLNSDFEAAEINFNHSREVIPPDSATDPIIALRKGDKEEPLEMVENLTPGEKYNGDKVRSRLHNLELELSSALRVLGSSSGVVPLIRQMDPQRVSEDYTDLSDELEFQENEIMNSQDKLRSLRARLAILEGKVSLTKIDKQKVIDEKRNRMNGSRKALQLLRTTCVVWPNSASEVLLSGSFDGWSTQRKMEKSRNGIFSLPLTLYPGTYEFKFIVDGVWKVDPLRPIVKNHGNENNQLIIM